MTNQIESLESRTLLTVTLDSIANQTFPGGKAILVPVTGTSTSGAQTTYTITSSNSQVTARTVTGLTYISMNISIGGTPQQDPLVFAMFGELAPKTVAKITSLVTSNFYRNNSFHRVIRGFMAQGGGVGSGTVPQIDDEYNANAIFASPYLLAMANSNGSDQNGPNPVVCDTGSSQFFVTVDDTRWLDFRHTIFGQLIRGRNTLDAIMAVPTNPDTDAPTTNVVITSAAVVADKVDTVLLVKGPNSASATITVRATDSSSTSTKTFTASAYADTQNDPPFLSSIPASVQTWANVPVKFNFNATDLDGNTPSYRLWVNTGDATHITAGLTGNTVVVTPAAGYSGTAWVLVAVQQNDGNYDSQWISINVSAQSFGTYDAATHKLTLKGSSGHDLLDLSAAGGTLTAKLNNISQQYSLAGISSISIDLGDGNDTLTVGIGVPAVNANGGVGNDTLTGGDAKDTLIGGDGNDSILGGNGNDSIQGNAGNDSLDGQGGNDTVNGGQSNDLIKGGIGDDSLVSGLGYDSIYGGDGNDNITGNNGTAQTYGEAGNDRVQINTSSGANASAIKIDLGSGNDTLTIAAGVPAVSVNGGTGDDSIVGGDGNDTLMGDDGKDTIYGGNGNDFVHGNAGNDSVSGGDGQDTVNGGKGHDFAKGDAGDDSVVGGLGNDTLYGGDGNDTISANNGAKLIYGESGNDLVQITASSSQISSTLIKIDLGEGNDTFTAATGVLSVSVLGGIGDDSIVGGDANDTLAGNDGNDTILGGWGNDWIAGHAGNDSLQGKGGNDTVNGGKDNDIIKGGIGNDLLVGALGDDTVYGADGNDTIIGSDGHDQIFADAGNDSIDITRTTALGVTVYGGDGVDTLLGSIVDDVIYEIETIL